MLTALLIYSAFIALYILYNLFITREFWVEDVFITVLIAYTWPFIVPLMLIEWAKSVRPKKDQESSP